MSCSCPVEHQQFPSYPSNDDEHPSGGLWKEEILFYLDDHYYDAQEKKERKKLGLSSTR